MKGLTTRQQQVLDFIRAFIIEQGQPPTVAEIAAHFGIKSTNPVSRHLEALAKKGHLKREPYKSRAITLTDPVRPAPAPSPLERYSLAELLQEIERRGAMRTAS